MNPTARYAAIVWPAQSLRTDHPVRRTGELSTIAQERLRRSRTEPLMISHWRRTLFIHLEADPSILQREVPFELDLKDGKAYVSLVAFHLENMRPSFGGRITEVLMSPIGTHELLNIRTYVRHRGESGIYFLKEYLPNRISALLGPCLYGLPYRFGCLRYEHGYEKGSLRGEVRYASGCLRYSGRCIKGGEFLPCLEGTLDEFLLERYTAFTYFAGMKRCFRIWHPPWPQCTVPVEMPETTLLEETGQWFGTATLVGAHFSPGVDNVWMGRPHFA